MGHFTDTIKSILQLLILCISNPLHNIQVADMIEIKSTQQLSKVKLWLRKVSRLLNIRRSSRIAASPKSFEFKTYSCLHVPNAANMPEVEIMHLTVRHEVDRPCRWIRGQVIEIDRERET